jgi:hypothetical protein
LSVWEATKIIEPHDQPWIWASYGFPSSLDQNWPSNLPKLDPFKVAIAKVQRDLPNFAGWLPKIWSWGLDGPWGLWFLWFWHIFTFEMWLQGLCTTRQGSARSCNSACPSRPFENMIIQWIMWRLSQKITYRDIILPHITTYYHFKRRTYMIGNRDTWVDTQFWDIDRTCRGALKRSSSQFQGTSPERSLQHEHP